MDERDITPGLRLTGSKLRDIIGGSRLTVSGGAGGVTVNTSADGRSAVLTGPPRAGRSVFWIGEIVSSSASGTNRWTYRVRELVKSATGYDQWATKTGGRDITGCLNLAEDQNAATGVQGNGVDVGDLVGTFAVQPIPTGTRVIVQRITLKDGSDVEHVIVGMPNGVTGDCPTTGIDNLSATVAPDTDNDNTEGYAVGSQWIDTTNKNSYVCVDSSTGAADWEQTNTTGGGGGSGDVEGPSSSVDYALAIFNGTTGKLLRETGLITDANDVLTVPGQGTGGISTYDLKVGDTDGSPTYGMIQTGNAALGRTSYVSGNLDLDGSIIVRNIGGPVTSEIEYCFADSSNNIRFALPKGGVGNATYNPRSMLIAGPAVLDDTVVTVGYWQTNDSIFDNLACDTSTGGADLGVQNDLEVEGDIYTDSIKGSTDNASIVVTPHGTGIVDIQSDLDVDGDITPSGTVDGRDLATDGTKLDGFDSGGPAIASHPGVTGKVLETNGASTFAWVDTPTGGGGGYTPQIFDALSSTTTAIGTGLTTILWDTANFSDTGYSEASGVVTIGADLDGKRARIDAQVCATGASNRVQLDVEIQTEPSGGGGYTKVGGIQNYTARNTTQNDGGIATWAMVTLATGMKIRIQALKVGSTANVVVANTRLTIETKS